MVRLLLRNEWNQLRNQWRYGGIKAWMAPLFSIIIGAVILYFLTRGAFSAGFMVKTLNITAPISIVFIVAWTLTLLIGIPQVFKQLFSASDLQTLFTLPIAPKSIFISKYLKSFFNLPGLLWLLMVVPLVGLGIGADYAWMYYPVLIIVSLGLTVIAVSVIYLINLGLIQVFPASRANELMTAMSVLTGLLVYLLVQMPTYMMSGAWSVQDFANMSGLPAWLPTTFGAHALMLASRDDFGSLLPTILVVLIALFLTYLASMLVEGGFRKGWIRLSEGSKRRKKQRQGGKRLYSPVILVGLKEWHSLRRDMREWVTLVPMLFFMVFPLINLFVGGGEDLQENPLMLWLVIQCFFLFFFGVISGILTLASVGREGKAAWLMRILPLKGWQIALGKFWIGWLIPFAIFVLAEVVFGLILSWSLLWILTGIGLFGVLSLGMNGISLLTGTLGAKYNPNNPQDRVQFGVRLIAGLANFIYMVLAMIPVAVILLPIRFQASMAEFASEGNTFIYKIVNILAVIMHAKADHEWVTVIICVLGVMLLSVIVSVVTLWLSAKRFDRGVHIDIVQGTKGKGLFQSPFASNRLK